ncbi:MAG: diguanylate cyclase [Aquabacterium sp.]|uniref:sensor domain-containing diguanylate cyclase n=1 Tax=Aquabacterium sp. TaxID=1872578 RepID=UPI0025C0E48C|nr:diguanylate cyclase [Aquabacterium sp.]MBI5926945.1 diguanylate cyclase [Aquabacterium sp.]
MCVLLLAGALLPGFSARAATPGQAIEVVLTDDQAELQLGPSMQSREDVGSRLDAMAAWASPAGDWHRQRNASINFGFSTSAWWTRVTLRNGTGQDLERILDLGSSLLDHVDIHVLRSDGTQLQGMSSGDRLPFASRGENVRTIAMRLHIPAGQQVTVLMRLQSHDGLNEIITPRLYAPEAFTAHVQLETLAFGIYYGLLATVLLYNLFLYASTRQTIFGIYAAYVGCFLLWGLVFRGYAFQYWWPDSPDFNNQALAVIVSALYMSLGLFLMKYLDTAHSVSRRMHRFAAISTAAQGLCILPAFLNLYAATFIINSAIGSLEIMGLTAIITVLVVKKKSKAGRYAAGAFTTLSVAALLYYLRVLGFVPANALTDNLLQIGSAAEALLLAFGLADQMNTLKTEKLHAERQALAAQTALNTQLESLVSSRTAELEMANERLANLAITDELTGAYNRRQFNKDLAAAAALHTRHQTPAALCLLDVDHFKAYNDRYGHPAGDEVLRQIATALRQQLQRASDHVYRVGGEEFAILLDINEPPDKVERFITQMLTSVQSLSIVHEGSPFGFVSVSMGLVILKAQGAPRAASELYSAADALLYQAKQAGRHQVISKTLD